MCTKGWRHYTPSGAESNELNRSFNGFSRPGGRGLALLQVDESRDGNGNSERGFRQLFLFLKGVHEHLDGLAGVRRNENGGGKQATADPGRAGVWQAVATEERKF